MEIRPQAGPTRTAPPQGGAASLEAPPPPQPLDEFSPAGPGSFSGDVQAHRIGGRPVWVYLPPAYRREPDKRFPVLYVHDGQNVFNRETAFGGVEWRLDEAAEEQISRGRMQDLIIVAVANAGAGRLHEYTHVPDAQGRGGGAEDYARFLLEEVKPAIDSTYRTRTEPETTGVMGSSLGGLVSLWLGYNHPGAFGLVGALSPSLWWAGRDMLAAVAAHQGPQPQAIWLTMGDRESQADENHNGLADTLENTRDLGNLLLGKGFVPGQNLHYHEIPGGEHNEASWSRQVGAFLSSLYPARP